MKTNSILFRLGAVTLFAWGFAGCDKSGTAGKQAPPPTPVVVEHAKQQTITEWAEFSARVDATETVEIRPRVTGHLAEVRFQAGQKVKKNDVLFVIDARWHEAEYQLAVANAEQAKARWETAKTEAKRGEDLVKSKAISSEEADNRRLAAQVAEGAFNAAEASRNSAKLNLDYTEVRTPIDGIVSRPILTAGNYVSGVAGFTTLLTTVVSNGDVFVYAAVDEGAFQKFQALVREKKLADPREGKVPAEIMVAGTGYDFKGFIEHFDNRIDSTTGSILLRVRVPNPEGRLTPGSFAKVRIPSSAEYSALLVDEKIIGTDQSQKFLLTVGANNLAEYKVVKLGPAIGGLRVISEGLKLEDRIITTGLQMLYPGAAVVPRDPTAPVQKTAAR